MSKEKEIISNRMKVPYKEGAFKKGTVLCPYCRTTLHFKNFQGMRITDEDKNYTGKCIKCNNYFKIKS